MAKFVSISALRMNSLILLTWFCALTYISAGPVLPTERCDLPREAAGHRAAPSPLFLQSRPSGEDKRGVRSLLEDTLSKRHTRNESLGSAGNEQLSSRTEEVLKALVKEGVSPGGRQKIQDLKASENSFDELYKLRQQAYKRCQAGEQEMCESLEAPLAKKLSLQFPSIRKIKPFTLVPKVFFRERPDEDAHLTEWKGSRQRRNAVGARRHSVLSEGQQRALSPLDDLKSWRQGEDQEFLELSTRGFFDAAFHVFLGGAGNDDPRNFEGGNQGSFFNFMYPADTDYPWACTCDNFIWEEWKRNETAKVPCKNSVDTSMQQVVSYCEPRLHMLNRSISVKPSLWAGLAVLVTMNGLVTIYACNR